MAEIKIQAFAIKRIEIIDDDGEYRGAREAEELGDTYDTWLSDMDGETIIIDPDSGQAINPYGGTADLMKLLEPILAHVPLRAVKDYCIHREQREAE